jgi:hypothetical protein
MKRSALNDLINLAKSGIQPGPYTIFAAARELEKLREVAHLHTKEAP